MTLLVAAALIFGEDQVPRKAEWLRQQLVAGKIPGRKAGRRWYMTVEDVDAALEIWLRAPHESPQSMSAFGLTPTSRSRRAS